MDRNTFCAEDHHPCGGLSHCRHRRDDRFEVVVQAPIAERSPIPRRAHQDGIVDLDRFHLGIAAAEKLTDIGAGQTDRDHVFGGCFDEDLAEIQVADRFDREWASSIDEQDRFVGFLRRLIDGNPGLVFGEFFELIGHHNPDRFKIKRSRQSLSGGQRAGADRVRWTEVSERSQIGVRVVEQDGFA